MQRLFFSPATREDEASGEGESSVVLSCPLVAPPPPSSELRCRFKASAASTTSTAAARYDARSGVATCVPPPGVSPGSDEFVLEDESSGKVFYRGRGDVADGRAGGGGDGGDAPVGEATSAPAEPSPPPADPSPSSTSRSGPLLPYAIISLSYVLFTTTDGAVRMIVLLHAYALGFTAMQLALVFSAYELSGVAVNLLAGMAGSRYGIKATLLAGLTCQLGALAMLAGWRTDWPRATAIAYVTVSQILNGVAKDLTKLGGKTVAKLVTPDQKQTRLFRLVALVTGLKNSAKGIGYLLGSALLTKSYHGAIGFMAFLILAAYPWAWVGLGWDLGRSGGRGVTLRSALSVNRRVGVLSLARFFLFASRDLWFEVTLPYFLRDPESGVGWGRVAVGAFLSAWIVLYGQVQSWSPSVVLRPLRQSPPNKNAAALWASALAPLAAALAVALCVGGRPGASPALFGPVASADGGAGTRAAAVATLTSFLYLFCVVFAVNSSVHSYLVVRYADGDKVASTVGFYYMSNAGGRLVGTLMSGAIYDHGIGNLPQRFGECLAAAAAFAAVAAAVVSLVREREGDEGAVGLRCGPCLSCLGAEEGEDGTGGGEGGEDKAPETIEAPPEAAVAVR